MTRSTRSTSRRRWSHKVATRSVTRCVRRSSSSCACKNATHAKPHPTHQSRRTAPCCRQSLPDANVRDSGWRGVRARGSRSPGPDSARPATRPRRRDHVEEDINPALATEGPGTGDFFITGDTSSRQFQIRSGAPGDVWAIVIASRDVEAVRERALARGVVCSLIETYSIGLLLPGHRRPIPRDASRRRRPRTRAPARRRAVA